MAQPALEPAQIVPSPHRIPPTVPALGMRGGLGKTLLIAFLLLTIVPLSLLAFLTYHQIQRESRQTLEQSLETIVTFQETRLVEWLAGYERALAALAANRELSPDNPNGSLHRSLSTQLAAIQAYDPALTALLLADPDTGRIMAAAGECGAEPQRLPMMLGDRRWLMVPTASEEEPPFVAVSHRQDDRWLIAVLNWNSFQPILKHSKQSLNAISTYLLTTDGLLISEQGIAPLPLDEPESLPEGLAGALQGQTGSCDYVNLSGAPVTGVYRWNPDLQLAILAEQPHTGISGAGDTVTAMVLGGTLVVALITAAMAAWVTRRLTTPIVQLTETAARMACGDLNQVVTIDRADEIGILARVFDRMASELKILYDDLEAKVVERTQQLERANERTRYHAAQLTLSAEVARVIASIRDLDTLLATVVDLIGRAFELHRASIYLLDEKGEWVVCRACSEPPFPLPDRERVGGTTLIGCVASTGRCQVMRAVGPQAPAEGPQSLQPPVQCELAIPLCSRQQMLGVLHLQSNRPDSFGEDDQRVYQSLADQISIAIENARAYAIERETVERLQELDRIQIQFMTHMSHALRTPLNSIIGFSRVLLKGLDGPLTELQRADLEAIHQNGRQLLGLIDDMLELSQLELGTMPFSWTEVKLAEVLEGVMTTARALARGKSLQIIERMPAELPSLCTDSQRIRQVLLAMLASAIKFSESGNVYMDVIPHDSSVTIQVSYPGTGLPSLELTRLLSASRVSESNGGQEMAGLSLALSKQVVEKLGGQFQVQSEQENGSVFTLCLPLKSTEWERDIPDKTGK